MAETTQDTNEASTPKITPAWKAKIKTILAITAVVFGFIFIGAIIYLLATKNQTLTFFPKMKVIEITNSNDKGINQKALEEGVRAMKECYTKIKS